MMISIKGMTNGTEPKFRWTNFKKDMSDMFYPENLRREKFNEFSQLTQGYLIFTEYKKTFDEYKKNILSNLA